MQFWRKCSKCPWETVFLGPDLLSVAVLFWFSLACGNFFILCLSISQSPFRIRSYRNFWKILFLTHSAVPSWNFWLSYWVLYFVFYVGLCFSGGFPCGTQWTPPSDTQPSHLHGQCLATLQWPNCVGLKQSMCLNPFTISLAHCYMWQKLHVPHSCSHVIYLLK